MKWSEILQHDGLYIAEGSDRDGGASHNLVSVMRGIPYAMVAERAANGGKPIEGNHLFDTKLYRAIARSQWPNERG